MMVRTLTRYFGWRFFSAVLAVFFGLLLLVAMVDFIEMLRRTSDMRVPTTYVAAISLYRVPFLTERILPFTVLVGAMVSYLSLSRRLELVVARSAGLSAWQFVTPAVVIAMLIGAAATTIYNPLSAELRERSTRIEGELFRRGRSVYELDTGFWIRQRNDDGGQAIINAKTSRDQGLELGTVTVFRLDASDHVVDRIHAKKAVFGPGFWRLEEARAYSDGDPPRNYSSLELPTSLTATQVRESFATPETVPFWKLNAYIRLAENSGLAAAGYRVQYYQLLAQPFYLAAMVLLASAVSLRLFRFGGIQKMVLGGITIGFFLYVLSKVTVDLSKAGLLPPLAAAALPPLIGAVTGVITLLHQEDG
jgi:lipopolysaccharide export system permease protein